MPRCAKRRRNFPTAWRVVKISKRDVYGVYGAVVSLYPKPDLIYFSIGGLERFAQRHWPGGMGEKVKKSPSLWGVRTKEYYRVKGDDIFLVNTKRLDDPKCNLRLTMTP